jgi:methylenetetrahydrofolate dehydrogenase (NADP+)/methenyltetrahydrofolate cyclohydrolase
MTAEILDGNAVAKEIREHVTEDVHELGRQGRTPFLVAIQVGDNPAAKIYANMQERSCNQVGIRYELQTLPLTTTQEELLAHLAMLNASPEVTGMILQLPVPEQIDARKALLAISQDKDVEGIHPHQMGRIFYADAPVAPCTPMAAMELLKRACPEMGGKEAVVVGHSEIVGKPMAMMLLSSRDAAPTVAVCHVATRDLQWHIERADIVIISAGVSQSRWIAWKSDPDRQQAGPPDLSPLIPGEWIKPGAVVIDIAINRIPVGFDDQGQPLKKDDGKLRLHTVGDVDFEVARRRASAITPVPGGVGPLTVAMLLKNCVTCAKRHVRRVR